MRPAALATLLTGLATLLAVRGAVIKGGVTIPTYAEPCKRNSPDFDDCLKNALQTIIPKLAKNGIKELGFLGLDPFYVPELLFNYETNDFNVKSIVKNSYTHGMAKGNILAVRSNFANPKEVTLEVDFQLPRVLIEGTYKMEGIVGNFPVNGRGVYNISMTNVSGTAKVTGHPVTVDNEEYLRIHRVGMRPTVGTMKVYASNLVNGNPELSAIGVTFANQFWRLFYGEMLPFAEQGFDKVLRNRLNTATLKIPYNQLFPLQ